MDQCLTPEQRSELSLLIPRDGSGLQFDDQLSISLGQHGQPVGRLRVYNALGTRCSTFRFDRSWLSFPERFLVSPDLRELGSSQWCRQPRSGGAHVFAGLHDTAPSGFGQHLLQRACSRGLMSLLGTADGQDSQTMALCAVPDHARLGALRVSALNQTPADPAPTKFFLPFACDIEHMGAMVRAFLDCRETPRQLLLLLYGFSALGGAQPKCSFVSEDRPLSVAKFFGPEHPSWMPRAEVLFSTLALAAGLRTVQPRLLHPIDSPIVITSRFDRDQAGRRTPYLSARSMLLIRPADRVSWMDLLAQMRLYCNNFATDALEIWRRLLFGYLIGKSPVGVDDFGFLYAGLGKWQLAPACGFRPSVPGTQSTTADSMQALAVPLDIESLMACADQFGLTQAQARVELRQQLDVLRTWKRRAVEFACNMNHRDIDQLAPIIDNIDVRQA